jgi:hypothetical protein
VIAGPFQSQLRTSGELDFPEKEMEAMLRESRKTTIS